MHHFRTHRSVIRIVSVSLLEWVKWGAATTSLSLLGYSSLYNNPGWILTGGWLAAGAVLAQVAVFLAGRQTVCPLCLAPVLGYPGCSKHRRKKQLMGSFRLKVAWDVLFHHRFVCPYCNERVAASSRE